MTPNPFLTVHGPRPAAWWATCDLCGLTSGARFGSAGDAAGWKHDCHAAADDDGRVTVTVEYTIDDPPRITWTGNLTHSRLQEIRNVFADMILWSRASLYRDRHPDWSDFVAAEWETRRRRKVDAALAEMHEIVERPFVCPGCKRKRCKTRGGLRTHMRSCRHVDPDKFRRGGYDHALVAGGAP